MAEQDYSDEQVKGLLRYAPPTTMSRWLLKLLVPSAWLVYQAVLKNPEWFSMQLLSQDHLQTTALASSIGMALSLSLLALLDICVYLSHRKHKVIIHENYVSPYMSFKMLRENATFKHWLALAFFGVTCMTIGFYLAKP
jgi:hypothetical protein